MDIVLLIIGAVIGIGVMIFLAFKSYDNDDGSLYVMSMLVAVVMVSLVWSIKLTMKDAYKQGNIDGMKGWYYYQLDTTDVNSYKEIQK